MNIKEITVRKEQDELPPTNYLIPVLQDVRKAAHNLRGEIAECDRVINEEGAGEDPHMLHFAKKRAEVAKKFSDLIHIAGQLNYLVNRIIYFYQPEYDISYQEVILQYGVALQKIAEVEKGATYQTGAIETLYKSLNAFINEHEWEQNREQS